MTAKAMLIEAMDAPCSDLEHTNGENFENIVSWCPVTSYHGPTDNYFQRFDFFPVSAWANNFPPLSDDGGSTSDVTGYGKLQRSINPRSLQCVDWKSLSICFFKIADVCHSQTENQLACPLDREFGPGVAHEYSQLPAYSSMLNQQPFPVTVDQAVTFGFSELLEPCTSATYRSEADDFTQGKRRPSLGAHQYSSGQSGESQTTRASPNSCKGRKSPPKQRARTLRTSRHNSIESKSPSPGKTSHSLVERKYRENLNAKLAQLHQALLNSDFAGSTLERPVDGEYSTMRPARKNDVLTNTITYIQQAEIDKRHMNAEILHLRARVAALEKLIKCEDCDLLQQLRVMQLQVPGPNYGTG